MTMQIPALLALLGTALLAIVIFAPRRPPSRVAATVSYAPPAAMPVERWAPPFEDDPLFAPEPFMPPACAPPAAVVVWPELVDAAAAGAAVETRLRLVEALGAVRTPWALAVLERAHVEERDGDVRAAIEAALRAA